MRRDPHRALPWVKVYTDLMESIANLSLADIGRLLLLLIYCGKKVNGGVIKGARHWTRKQWRNELHFDEILTKNQPNFWHFSQENLIVDAYDVEAENKVISMRRTNSSNAEKKPVDEATCKTDCDITSTLTRSLFDDDDDSGQARRPENIHEVEEFLREHEKHMSREQIAECAGDFWRMNEERGWKDSTGEPLRNWQGAARGYADKWRQRTRTQRSGGAWHKQTKPKTTGGSLNDPMP